MSVARWQYRLLLASAAITLALLTCPLLYSLWISFSASELLEVPTTDWSLRWYRAFFSDRRWIEALWNSFEIGALSALLALIAGSGLAFAIVRYPCAFMRGMQAFSLLPLAIPALVFGIALLPVFRSLGLHGTKLSVAAAHSLLGLPLVTLSVRAALKSIDARLLPAARGLGASPAAVLRLVVIPLLAPGLLIGALLAFLVSMNELVIALFLCAAETETLPKVIWPSLRYTLSPIVAAASSLTVLLTSGLLVLGWAFSQKIRLGKIRPGDKG